MSGARVGGGLSLAGATLGNGDGELALLADRIEVRGSVSLEDLTTNGEASVSGAGIGGQLVLDGATCTNDGGDALVLDSTKIGSGLFASRLTATGTVRLIGIVVAGELFLRDAVLSRDDGVALLGDGLTAGSLLCEGLRTTGELRVQDARVTGAVSFDGAVLTNPGGHAVAADNLHVGTNLFCRNGFAMAGSLGLNRARIGVSLSLRNASMKNSGGVVLDGSGLEVGQHVLLGPNLVVEGDVDLRMARIDGALGLGRSTMGDAVAIRLPDARAGQWADFQWPDMPTPLPWYKRWKRRPAPAAERPYAPHISGFVYDSFGPETDDVATRLDWIAHAERPYIPQAYDQLASVYRAAGREEDARDVMVAKERRKRGQLRLPGRLWNRFLDITVGFGYHTGRAVFGLIAVMLIGWPVFAWASWEHLRPLKNAEQLPQFMPWLYSMDAVLPVITFGQESAWAPTGLALYWYAFSVLAGWILGTALIAALTAMLNRS